MHSPFKHVLHTNYVPTPSEARQIEDHLWWPLRHLAHLEAEITRLRSITYNLSRERDQVAEFVDEHRALVSPMRRLPVEVIQHIFMHCVSSRRYSVMHRSEAPILLGCVCSGWRKIALEMPQLWTDIHIAVYPRSFSKLVTTASQLKCETVNTWLSRSGTLPLSFTLCVLEHDTAVAAPLLKFLASYANRWKHIRLQVPSIAALKSFLRLTSEDVPLLESFKVEDYLSDGSIEHSSQFDELRFLKNAPRLRSFSTIRSHGNLHLPASPWEQLTELCISANVGSFFLDTSKILELLRQCPILQTLALKFRDRSFDRPFLPLPEPINLLHLQTLSIDANQYSGGKVSLPDIFDNIVVPSLLDIQIKGNFAIHRSARRSLTSFNSLLVRSSCRLEKLTLQCLRESEETFIECLRLLPNLTTLIIDDQINTILLDRALLLLTPAQDSSVDCLCPNLDSLTFAPCVNISDGVLLNLLRARCTVSPGIKKLKRAEILIARQITLDIAVEMQPFVAEGLILKLL